MKSFLKKTILGISIISLLSSTSVFASDVSTWAQPEYNTSNEHALLPYAVVSQDMTGYITRIEFCDLIMNTYQKMTGEALIQPTIMPFTDTNSLSVAQAYYYGIVSGDENGLFNPQKNITRQEMAQMLLNLLIATESNVEISRRFETTYKDANLISDWSILAMSTVLENDIFEGIDNCIEPHSFATREQAIVAVTRLYKKFSYRYFNGEQPKQITCAENLDENKLVISWQSIYHVDKYLVIIKNENNELIYTDETPNNYIEIDKNALKSNNISIIVGAVTLNNGTMYALPTDYELTCKTPTINNLIIETAKNFLGTPYVWGGTTPSGFDCSGFVQYVYSLNGYSLTRTTYTQWANDGTYVPKEELQPGDLVYFGKNGSPSHVGLYVGDGTMIHSPQTGDVVKYTPINTGYYSNRFIGGKRIV